MVAQNPYEPTTAAPKDISPPTHNPAPAMVSFVIGALAGFFIWAASNMITGKDEPWDSRTFYYPVALAIGGAISTACYRKSFLIGPLGILAGQAAFVFFLIVIELGIWNGLPMMLLAAMALILTGIVPTMLGALPVFVLSKLTLRRGG